MPITEAIQEMEGKISLLDNKKFLYSASLVGVYYLAFIGFLIHVIVHTH
ncbi:MAG TPA: hypothetical protein VGN00_24710 [Puia sp.]|jgi:hypothetical protein